MRGVLEMKTINKRVIIVLAIAISGVLIICISQVCNFDRTDYNSSNSYIEFDEMLNDDKSWVFYRNVYSDDAFFCRVQLTKYGKLKSFLLENGVSWVAVNDKGELRVSIYENEKICNLEFCKGLPIISLSIRDCVNLIDISAVNELPLVHLDISGLNITDLKDLCGLPLLHIRLFNIPATDIMPLSRCTKLRSIVISNVPVQDLSPLSDLSLKSIYLKNILSTDLSPLLSIQGLGYLKAGCGYVVCGNPD